MATEPSKSAQDRLKAAVHDAYLQAPNNYEGQHAYLMKRVQGDAGLAWAMFFKHFDTEARTLLRAEYEAQKSKGASGKVSNAARLLREQQVNKHPRTKLSAADEQAIRSTVRVRVFSALDRMMIDGKPLGDCTPAEAMGWAKGRVRVAARDAEFIELLCQNLPPNRPIRKSHRPEDVNKLEQDVNDRYRLLRLAA